MGLFLSGRESALNHLTLDKQLSMIYIHFNVNDTLTKRRYDMRIRIKLTGTDQNGINHQEDLSVPDDINVAELRESLMEEVDAILQGNLGGIIITRIED